MRPTSDLQVGPYVLAALQRALGPECAADEIGKCVAQWAFGTIALGAAVLGLLALAGGVAARLLRRHGQSGGVEPLLLLPPE